MTRILAYGLVFVAVMLGTYAAVAFYGRYRKGFLDRAEVDLEKLWSPLTARQLWLYTVLGIAVLGGGLFLASGFRAVGLLVGVMAGFLLPRFYMRLQAARRLRKFDEQLVDALMMVANSLKAGSNLNQALEMVMRRMGPPIGQEFGLAIKENRLGTPLKQAFNDLTKRVPSVDLKISVDAMNIAVETGGSLAETFERIADTIRERNRVKGRLDALTSSGRMQGIVVTLVPWVLLGVLYVLEPKMVTPLFTRVLGQVLLAAVVILELLGWFFIRRILTVDV